MARESFSIKKSGDKFEVLDSNKRLIIRYTGPELIRGLTISGLSSINSKAFVDDLESGEKKIKVIITTPELWKAKLDEGLSFERGQSPKTTMGVGIESKINEFVKNKNPFLNNLTDKTRFLTCINNQKWDYCKYLIDHKEINPFRYSDVCLNLNTNQEGLKFILPYIKKFPRSLLSDYEKFYYDEGIINLWAVAIKDIELLKILKTKPI